MSKDPLHIWLVKRPGLPSYGQWESFVVVAATEREARLANPAIEVRPEGTWNVDPDLLIVQLIGTALPDVLPGIIHASLIEE